ncbi:Tol-Pal system protein TolB [Durusdinium trenchii]|uniref:Tol-Pal system protein TolB n=1 Tax=Durusdinium trenchii TaxID=1381693 RepID=A0ABP0ST14_9DINO
MGTDGGLLYGGLQFEAVGAGHQLTVWDADGAHFITRPCPFVRHESQPVFNRVSIRSKGDSAQFLSNLHPVWTDSLGHTSPWLGLRSHGENRPVFRNLKLTGDPIIPREVQLTAGDQLRGWQSAYFGESQPTFHSGGVLSEERGTISAPNSEQGTPDVAIATESPSNITFGWKISDGIVSAGKSDQPTDGVRHSLLRYQRPLLEGESIRYEFFYEPDAKEVHPAVGQLAFLLEPNGIRVRWLTSNNVDWTGLAADNALLEPLNRRGPRTLPLKENDWNAALVSLAEGRIQITLNDELVYERTVDFDGDLLFGLYRDANRTSVEVRNVMMTGDWPEEVPEECLANPAVVDDPEVASSDRRVSLNLIGDRTIAENVEAVRRHAMTLPPEQRFHFLKGWVLPSSTHTTMRLSGTFSPVDPPPPKFLPLIAPGSAKPGFHAVSPSRGEQSETPASADSTSITADAGLYPSDASDSRPRRSVLVSPAFDLLDTAKQLGRLAELREQIAALPDSTDPIESRARAALLSMIGLQQNDQATANQAADQLYELLPDRTPTSLNAMWPETLATWRAFAHLGYNESLAEVLKAIYQQRSMRLQPQGVEFWHTHMHDLMCRLEHRLLAEKDEPYDSQTGLDHWIPVVRLRALSRGKGSAAVRWHRTADDEVHHVSGHQDEYLFYRSPLRGNYEVTCEIGGFSTTQVLLGGRFHGPGGSHNVFETGSFRKGIISRDKIPEAFSKMDKWVTYRVAVRNNRYAVSIHGRPVHEQPLPEHADPWLGIHSWFRNPARVRDVRISGEPIIPDEVLLSATPDLDGWLPYFDEWVGDETAPWFYTPDPESGGIITGRLRTAIAGTACESLLSYQRPLVENGSISFEFYYEPGKALTHPALDRIAFLLRPEGVRLHWITDGPYERAFISPDNEFLLDTAIPAGPLLLHEGKWNHARLNLEGRQLLLEINGQPALTYELDPNNRRTFGLFHFAGESAVRVRNVIMRGDWPKTIPEPASQELASPIVPTLDAERDELAKVFEHSFAIDGLDDRYFTFHDPNGGAIVQHTLLGVRVSRRAFNSWTGTDIRSPFILRGDFDVETEFEGFAHEGEKSAAAILQIRFDDERQPHSRIARNRLLNGQRQALQASKSLLNPDGSRDFDTSTISYEGTSGRMRIARRGSTVYCLFAEGDSQTYRLFGTHEVTARDTLPDGIWLHAVANGQASVHVTWKNLRIAAEELLIAPTQPPQTEIFVMNADGSNLRAVTKEVTADYGKGSPDWSPDGKQIAFDIYTGRSATSKCYLINVDGTGLVDLGLGLMPNFSPDGQRLAFTWSGQGMSLMDLDGTNREVLTGEGWGAQWSPDGRWVAYQSSDRIDNQYRANITIIDVETREKRVILQGDQAGRYRQILWNMEWSPDSQRICFKGRLADRSGNDYETVITSIAGSTSGFHIVTDETTDTDFGWHPDGRRILIAKISPKHGGMKLFVYDLDAGTMEMLPHQPLDTPNMSGVWSPDGSRIAFVSRPKIEPVPWEPPGE